MDGIIIRTGPSPLDMPEFSAIRDEINKLSHPSQPQVSWSLIESLALSLFKHNGVDLQTAVYYTLARLQRNGLTGFTEGTELIAMMVVHDWDDLWPSQENHRIDIINWFNTKAIAAIRKLSFSKNDLRLIYRAERALQLITDKLTQIPSSKEPKTGNLQHFFHNLAQKTEAPPTADKQERPSVTLAPLVYITGDNNDLPVKPLRTSAHSQEPVRIVHVQTDPPPAPPVRKMSGLTGFLSGAGLGVIAVIALFFTVYKPVKEELSAFIEQPGSASVQWFAHPQLATYGQFLSDAEKQSPLAPLNLADKMTEIARRYWPNSPDQAYATRRWQNVLQTRIADVAGTDSWYVTSGRLQALADKIVTQEKNRGSFTLSYLKTEIYNIQQNHNKTRPAEDYLRELSADIRSGKPISPAQIYRIDQQLNGLLALYADLQKQAENAGLKPGTEKQE